MADSSDAKARSSPVSAEATLTLSAESLRWHVLGVFAAAAALLSPWVGPVSPPTWVCTILAIFFTLFALTAIPALVMVLAYLADQRQLLRTRDEPRLDGSSRPQLSFTQPTAWAKLRRDINRPQPPTSSLWPASKPLSDVTDTIIKWIIRDFVSPWHTPLTARSGSGDEATSNNFPRALDHALRHALRTLGESGSRLDLSTLVVRGVLPKVTNHISVHRRAVLRLHGPPLAGAGDLNQLSGDSTTDIFLAKAYEACGGSLHAAVASTSTLDTRHTEQAHLRSSAERILAVLLPEEELRSPAVRVVARELLACTVLTPLVDSLSDPDTINSMLEHQASVALQEQKLITQLRETLDREQKRSRTSDCKDPYLSSYKDVAFSDRTKRGQSLGIPSPLAIRSMDEAQARRLKTALVREANKMQSDTGGSGLQTDSTRQYKRMKEGIVAVDARLAQLDHVKSEAVAKALPADDVPKHTELDTTFDPAPVTLQTVLKNSLALSHFLEWMERRGAGQLVQCWMSMSVFRQPLEEVDSDAEEQNPARHLARSQNASRDALDVLLADLRPFVDHYFPGLTCINIRDKEAVIRATQESSKPDAVMTHTDLKAARRSVLKALHQIEMELLDEYWPSFVRSRAFARARRELARDSGSDARQLHTSQAITSADRSRRSIDDETVEQGMDRSMHSADLFGHEPIYRTRSPSPALSTQAGTEPLPGTRAISKVARKGSRATHNLDLLIGGAGTVRSPSERPPLFRENLFEDGEADDSADQDDTEEAPLTLRADRMDALADALANLIADDGAIATTGERVLSHPTGTHASNVNSSSCSSWAARPSYRTGTRGSATAKQDLRPAFKRSSSGPNSDGPRSSQRDRVFGDDDNLEKSGSSRVSEEGDAVPLGECSAAASSSTASHSAGAVPIAESELAFDFVRERTRLCADEERVRRQHELLSALIRKAELTGAGVKELRLLTQSQKAAARDLSQLSLAHAELQERKARSSLVMGLVEVSIPFESIMAAEVGAKDFAVYHIQVDKFSARTRVTGQDAQENSQESRAVESGWVVARRYSEFAALNDHLSKRFSEVHRAKGLFPSKRIVVFSPTPLVEGRRQSLENWLRALLLIPTICTSPELEAFLNPAQMHVLQTTLEAAVKSSGMDTAPTLSDRSIASPIDAAFEMVVSLTDSLGIPLPAIVSSRQSLTAGLVGRATGSTAVPESPLQAESQGKMTLTPFTEPICALLFEVFQLSEKDQWFRRQSLVIVLQQALGGTIERKIREAFSSGTSSLAMTRHLTKVRDSIWPNGTLKKSAPPRSQAEKDSLKINSLRKCYALLPDIAASFMGKENARKGARDVHSVLQSKRLNKSLIYSVLDLLLDEFVEKSRQTPV
ncbi:Intermediate filament-like protein, sorting nexins, and related proteins containing PX (PhoX) domain(s) [Ceraceosorus bombacis]|uniref:Intermediate filament-like protein, sorting nexins, and related proteins containing PX (PhoX) domain(S) n=1 Tax=Ceraceosorus bombacis TaxID=401625 RepID=A0A0P1BQB1_9BASI|nr:Intermediate filament-like protein, sorting nexins, and related proteins containing PX (PhoX) domain(s) [Ceraceosorus bombacis]